MGVFDRLERGLERAVKQPFARVFKAEVQPVEIASAIRGAMDDRAAVLGPGRTMVPNVFTIELAETDHERLSSYSAALTDELVAAAEDHADAQRYVAPGPFEVRLTAGKDLETGIFRVRPAAKDGRAGRGPGNARQHPGVRPHDRHAQPGPAAGRGPAEERRPADEHAAYRPQPRTPADRLSDRGPGAARAGAAGAAAPAAPGATREVPAGRPPRGRGPRPALEIDGRPVPLTAAVTTIGRDQSADVVVDDPGVSRRHAEVRISHDGPHLQVILRDLGSTNGTFLNGEPIGDEELREGDRITMGRSSLIFRLEG